MLFSSLYKYICITVLILNKRWIDGIPPVASAVTPPRCWTRQEGLAFPDVKGTYNAN
jgi:hypothetical protein